MDHQTRRRHGRQELAAVFGLLMLLSIGLVVLSLSGRHWTSAALAGPLSVGMGLNLYARCVGSGLPGATARTEGPNPP